MIFEIGFAGLGGILRMEWTRSETIALAANNCTSCHGLGLLPAKRGGQTVCNCVFRAIFRICYNRFRTCVTKEKYMTRVTMSLTRGRERHFTWSRKDEEYIADFTLVARRSLNEADYKIFKYHYLLGADWKLCCRKLKMDRGRFFHAVYRIQQRLGRIFRELQPYGLYPLDEYFGTTVRGVKPLQPTWTPPPAVPVRPPVLQQLQRAA
jgi:hypothetical protein